MLSPSVMRAWRTVIRASKEQRLGRCQRGMRCLAREHIDLVVAPVPITQTTNVVRVLFVLEWRGVS